MNKLSVVIITFNEEDNISRCLDSVRILADEIVIVDSFSTDRTKNICLEYGARFIEHTFEGHIEQKNYAASLATGEYIFSLDADEALDTVLQKSILREKKNFSHDGYFMNRMTNYLGKWIRHGAWYPDSKLRLWRKDKGNWGGQNPHDKFELDKGCSSGRLRGDILHYSYKTIEGHIAQFDKFTTISALELYKEGKKASCFKILFSPLVCFFKGFFIKFAFLDGYYGMMICIIDTFSSYIKYVKLRELYKSNK